MKIHYVDIESKILIQTEKRVSFVPRRGEWVCLGDQNYEVDNVIYFADCDVIQIELKNLLIDKCLSIGF